MADIDAAIATFERNIAAKTGRAVEDWVALVSAEGLARHGEMVAWLKAGPGLSHGHANHIAKRALEAAAPRSDSDPVAHLFDSEKASLRPLYDHLTRGILDLGSDIELAPKKANVSVRRARQFALIQPSTRTRLDLGLILKGRQPEGRLEASGSFNAMFTHRVRLTAAADVDPEVRAWLRDAYDQAH